MTSNTFDLITSLNDLPPEQILELVSYIKQLQHYNTNLQTYNLNLQQYYTSYYLQHGYYPNTNPQSQPQQQVAPSSPLIEKQNLSERARELNLETGAGLVFSVNYKTTPTGKETMESSVTALKSLYSHADILPKQSSDPKVICSVTLVSMGGQPINYKVWVKEHGIERHYTDTLQSDAKALQSAAEDAVQAAATLRSEGRDKEYEYFSRILSD